MEENKIDYKRLYEQEAAKYAQLEKRYNDAIIEKARAERKSLDVINHYEGVLLELERLREEYRNCLKSLIEKRDEIEKTRRTLLLILHEIKKSNPRKIGADIDID